jgi:hypothetical protein
MSHIKESVGWGVFESVGGGKVAGGFAMFKASAPLVA